MPSSYEHNSASQDASVEALAAQVRAASESLPVDELTAAYRHIDAANTTLATAAETTAAETLQRAHDAIGQAVGHVAAAIGHNDAAQTRLEEYAADITGQGTATTESTLVPGAANSESSRRIKAEVILEKRHVADGTEYTFALCEHSAKNAAVIAKMLKDCRVIVLECAGSENDDDRKKLQFILSKLASSNIDPALFEKLMEGREDNFAYALAAQLKGTDTLFVPIDISKQHPDYYLVDNYERAETQTAIDGYQVAPVGVMRDHMRRQTDASVKMDDVRDIIMSEQLLQLHQQLVQHMPQAPVGVVPGKAHYRILEKTGFDTTDTAKRTKARILRSSSPALESHIQQSEGLTVDPKLMDRVVLNRYIDMLTDEGERGVELSQQLTDDQVTKLLQGIDGYAHLPIDSDEKHRRASQYLQQVLEQYETQTRPQTIYNDVV
jgi:hypothetical protein